MLKFFRLRACCFITEVYSALVLKLHFLLNNLKAGALVLEVFTGLVRI